MLSVLLTVALSSCSPPAEQASPPVVLITLEGNGPGAPDDVLEVREEFGLDGAWQAVASSAHVVPALGSLHTGLRPWQHGAIDPVSRLHPGCETLALAFRSLGYETLAYADRAGRLDGLGFARGYSRFGALRSGKRALSELDSLQPGTFVWLHFRFDPRRGARQQWRRVRGALQAAAQSTSWPETVVAIVGVTGPGARGLDSRALSVPIYLRSPGGVNAESRTVAAAQIYETLNGLAGGEPLPATAPSLFARDVAAPLLSSRYGPVSERGRTYALSLVEGDRQLLWRGAARSGELPLSGAQGGRLELRRWPAESTSQDETQVSVDEPQLRETMADRLRRAWLADLDGEESMHWPPLESRSPSSLEDPPDL